MRGQLKAYDSHNRLWISKKISEKEAVLMLAWLQLNAGVNKAWFKTGNSSKVLPAPAARSDVFDTFYLGADGVKTWTIPIRLSAYPFKKFNYDHDKKSYIEIRSDSDRLE